ncbi:hypothetical protein D3C81_1681030 [compost metagenome]
MVEADGVGQQLVVLFGVGEDRQHADLMHQAGQGGLVGHQAGVVAAEYVADAGDLRALVPHFAHLAVDHVGGGLEHLLHRQAGGEVAGVVDAEPADGGLQVGDFLAGAQQRAVHHLDDSGGQCGVVADHLGQVLDAGVRVFGGLAHAERHLRQGRQHQFVVVDGLDQFLLDFVGKLAHWGSRQGRLGRSSVGFRGRRPGYRAG